MKSGANWLGEFDIVVRRAGKVVERHSLKNRLMNVGLNMMRDVLDGAVTDGELKYLALGTSAAAIDDTDTTLGAEGFRKAFTSQTAGGTGELDSTVLVTTAEANVAIKEIGIFAGAAAGAGADSGIMVSRVLWTHTKTSDEEIEFVRTDTIGRG
jgi:hypothetical protein